MKNTNRWTATRKDAAFPAAHGGTLLASRKRSVAPTFMGIGAPAASVAPTYVVDQESPPPRGNSA